jgi:N-terminal domain of reverse transcriptase
MGHSADRRVRVRFRRVLDGRGPGCHIVIIGSLQHFGKVIWTTSEADISAATTLAGAAPDQVVNWNAIDRRKVYRTARRRQAHIVKAVQKGRWNKAKALVYLLIQPVRNRSGSRGETVFHVFRTPGSDFPQIG